MFHWADGKSLLTQNAKQLTTLLIKLLLRPFLITIFHGEATGVEFHSSSLKATFCFSEHLH